MKTSELLKRLDECESTVEKTELLKDLHSEGELEKVVYPPTNTLEYFDGENYFNLFGQQLKKPDEVN